MSKLFVSVYTFLAAILFCSISIHAQGTLTRTLLTNLEQADTPEERIDLMLKLTEAFKMRHLPTAIDWGQKTIDLAERQGEVRQLARAYELFGDVISMEGNFVKGATYFDKAIQTLEPLNDSLSLAQKYHALMYSGGWLTPLDAMNKKVEYGLQSVAIYSKLRQRKGVALAHYSLGIIYSNKAKYETPSDTINDRTWYRQARYHNEQAERFYLETDDIDGVAASITAQAQNDIDLGLNLRALDLLLRAEKICEKEENNIGLALCKWFQATIYRAKKEFKSALELIKQSDEFLHKAGYQPLRFELYDFELAIYQQTKDYEHALASSMKARKMRDEYYNYQRNTLIADIQNSYENQLKDKQIRFLDAENKLKTGKLRESKIIYWGTTCIFVLAVLGLSSYIIQRQKIVKQLKKTEVLNVSLQKSLETQLYDAQLSAARAQMNPHFVFNAINAIQNLILMENKKDALNYLNDFSRLTRITLENSKEETITLEEEVDFLQYYIRLEQLRYPNKFDYELEMDQSIDDAGYERVPPMMIQPFVENAIKHGLRHKEGKGLIRITFSIVGAVLICIIEDNGIGRNAAASLVDMNHSSMATTLTDARLQLLQKKSDLKEKYKIRVEDLFDIEGNPSGTKVQITIPNDSRLEII